jgi:hypothetical protein
MTAPKRQNISPKAASVIQRIYAVSPTGCCWHVVLDDGNYDWIPETCVHILNNLNVNCKTKGGCYELALLAPTASMLKRAMRFREAKPILTVVLRSSSDGSLDIALNSSCPIEFHLSNETGKQVYMGGKAVEFIGPIQQKDNE